MGICTNLRKTFTLICIILIKYVYMHKICSFAEQPAKLHERIELYNIRQLSAYRDKNWRVRSCVGCSMT